jgi:serpin B
VLGITDLERYNEGMDSLALLLRSRAGEVKNGVGAKATVTIDIANSLWGQRGARWEQPFLEALARYYGTGLHLVDYIKASERARSLINAWVATQTHDKIPALIPAGVLDAFTRLVLVNAISFKAPWDMQFHPHQTKQRPFTLADGRRVMVETMRGKIYVPVTQSSRWRAGRLPYAGGRLAMTIVVPTISLQDLESSLDGAALRAMLDPHAKRQRVEFSLPTWRFRLSSRLDDALSALGMPIAFSSSADFSGMTKQDDLRIGAVQHEAYISVDEKGTEAAAATAVVAELLSLAPPPPAFTVDRPFLFVIHDVESTAPLFIGRVTDPTAGDA